MNKLKLTILMMLIIVTQACRTSLEYTKVENQSTVPEKTTCVVALTNMPTVQEALTENLVLFEDMTDGIETVGIFLDEQTEVMYQIYEYDGRVKVISYWRPKLPNTGGYGAVNKQCPNPWQNIVYTTANHQTKMVVDYMVQILRGNNIEVEFY